MTPERLPARDATEIAVSIPRDYVVHVTKAECSGDFDGRYSRAVAEIGMSVNSIADVQDWGDPALNAEFLPQSLAYLLARAVATPIEVPVLRPPSVDWHVTDLSVMAWQWDVPAIEIKFEAAALLDARPARLHWHLPNFTAPTWFADAIRAFVGPLFRMSS